MVSLMGNLTIDEIPSALSGPLFPYCPYIEEADFGPYHVIEEEGVIMGTHEVEALPSAIDEGPAPGSVPLFGWQYHTIEEEEIMGTHEVEALPSILDPPVPIEIEIVEKSECSSNSDCPPGFACVFSPGAEEGTCIKIGEIGVRIVGVIDSVTCDYCLSQIGRTGALDSMPIPPFHKYCRCSLEYLG